MKTLVLHGSAYERGRQHGSHFRTEIAELMARWKESLARELKLPADEALRQFLTATDFLPAIRRWTPDLLEEVRGIADGAGQPFDAMLAFQLGDELYAYLDLRAHEHCSAIGIAPGPSRSGWVAQTMDIEPLYDGYQTILRIAGDSGQPEQLILTYPGLIGLNGMNDRSIAVACNTLLQLAASPTGLPQSFVVRGILAQREADAALAFIRTVSHASGQNYLLGTRSGVFAFEASARRVVELKPNGHEALAHTNHPLSNDDLKPWARPALAGSDSAERLDALQRRLTREGESFGRDHILGALRSQDSAQHPICRPVRTGSVIFSFSAVVMTLGETPLLEASPGPPDAQSLERFEFSPPPPPDTPAEPPSLYERLNEKLKSRPDLAALDQPPGELKLVDWMIGQWEIEATVYATRSSPERVDRGEARISAVIGGGWLQSADTYPTGTQDLGFLTYNRVTRQWVSVSLDSTGNTVIATSPGWVGDEITFDSPQAEILGEKVVLRQVLRKITPDEFEFINEEYMPSRTWRRLDRYHYRRSPPVERKKP